MKKIALWTIGSLLGLVLILTLITLIFEEEIKQKAVQELNRHLNTEVRVREVNLSLWKKWPYASLEFKEVFVPDAYEDRRGTDTLLYAKRLFLEFDVSALWNSNYQVEEIEVEEGNLNVRRDLNGAGNYHVWRLDTTSTSTDVEFSLKGIHLHDMVVNYLDEYSGHHFYTHVDEALLSGEFSAAQYDIKADARMRLQLWRDQNISMLRNRDVVLNTVISVNTEPASWSIRQGKLKVDRMDLVMNGHSSPNALDFHLTGDGLDLADLIKGTHLPTISSLRKHRIQGRADLKVDMVMDSTMGNPKISAEFHISDGRFHEPSLGVDASHIQLASVYSQHEGVSSIYVDHFSMDLIQGHVKGRAAIADFSEPLLDIELQGNAQLREVRNLLNWNEWEHLSGMARMNLALLIKLPKQGIRNDELAINKLEGNVSLQNVDAKYVGYPLCKVGTGDFRLSRSNLGVKDLKMQVGSSDLHLNGTVQNFQNFLNGLGQMKILVDAKSQNLVVSDFYARSTAGSSENVVLPTGIYARVNASCGRLTWAGHVFDHLNGTVELSDKTISTPYIRFKASEGSWSGNLTIKEIRPGVLAFKGKQRLSGVSMSKLFADWNDFSQSSVTHKQIHGSLNSTLDYAFLTDGKGNLDYSSLVAQVDVDLTNGRLENLGSMATVMDFLRTNKSTKVVLGKHLDDLDRRLSDIRFSRLKNTILIKDGLITIPDMDIGSSALSLHFQGTHSLKDIVDYRFDFRFRDLKMDESDSEFGVIQDDGLGIRIFLRMFGPLDDPEFEMDKESQKENRQEMIAQEKATVKSMLKTELGLFSKDTSVNTYHRKKEQAVEVLVGEDEVTHQNRVKKERSALGKFLQKQKAKQQEETSVEWELETN